MKFVMAIAQYRSHFADIDRNIDGHIDNIRKARENKAKLILFPELSLTGYYLRELVPDVAVNNPEIVFKKIIELSDTIDIVAGFVEESAEGLYYNSMIFCHRGEISGIQRKLFLPDYGMFEEGRYFASGENLHIFESNTGNFAILICEDAWHPELVLKLTKKNINFLAIVSASPVKGFSEDGTILNAEVNYGINNFYSQFLGAPVIFVNKAGFENGVKFWGGSAVFTAGGGIEFCIRNSNEDLFFHEIDLRKSRKAKISFPYLRDIDFSKNIITNNLQ